MTREAKNFKKKQILLPWPVLQHARLSDLFFLVRLYECQSVISYVLVNVKDVMLQVGGSYSQRGSAAGCTNHQQL